MDSSVFKRIAYQTHGDVVNTGTIVIVTVFFLPATFVSAFFRMSFFQTGGPLSFRYLGTMALCFVCSNYLHLPYYQTQEPKQEVNLGLNANYKKAFDCVLHPEGQSTLSTQKEFKQL